MRAELAFRWKHAGEDLEPLRAKYTSAQPFPHIVIDDFLPPEFLEEVLVAFPERQDIPGRKYATTAEKKNANEARAEMAAPIRRLLDELNAGPFIDFLEGMTGIEGLIPDPHFRGGGMHQIRPGGFLKVHADFNWHNRLKLDRRLNLLLYLNRDWKEEYNGHLELWDQEMTHAVHRVLPIFNRCVVFSTTDFAFHGLPEPVTCPPDRSRRSLALYYYSNGRPEHERAKPHTTLFQERPGEDFVQARNRKGWRAKVSGLLRRS